MLNLKREVTSKSIGGISDLVVWAPIRQGFIHAFENVTYETRLKRTAEALHRVRVSAREHETIAPFPDTAERILSLLNFRIGIIDDQLFRLEPGGSTSGLMLTPRRYMYLVATFDGPWEPYMRLIWDPLGPFLDLLLCNCVPYGDPANCPADDADVSLDGYRLAQKSTFEDYARWVRAHQLDPAIFYSTTGLTVRDQIYLAKLEKMQRELVPAVGDEAIAKMTHDLPEALAATVRQTHVPDTVKLGLEALTVLYRLADYYPPYLPNSVSADDGGLLLRASYDLLSGFGDTLNALPAPLKQAIRSAYAEPLNWFDRASGKPTTITGTRPLDKREVQKGILSSYDEPGAVIAHGAVLFLQITDAARARDFLATLSIDWEDAASPPSDGIFRNIAFTFEGLRRLELSPDALLGFPKEFREGSVDRAPMLGDIGQNHPRKWRMPPRNWPVSPPTGPHNTPIDLSEIDIVLQLRKLARSPESVDFIDFAPAAHAIYAAKRDLKVHDAEIDAIVSSAHPLACAIAQLAEQAEQHGVVLLGFESAVRFDDPAPPCSAPAPSVIDHFGFRDGLSQPSVDEALSSAKANDVPPGDLICGYRNSLSDADWSSDSTPGRQLLDHGSFMVLRKMSQDPAALERFLARAEHDNPGLTQAEIAACLVGRTRDGDPLAAPGETNDFTYAGDLAGEACPFAAHIRRANPRDSFQGRPAPRILRRGMTFGHRYPTGGPGESRGSLFIAYAASIAEQYEVVQRWLNGGNPTHIGSAQNDPLTGIAPDGGPRTFRFIKDGVRRLTITEPFVGLDYMLYLFMPSKSALRRMIASTSQTIGQPGNQASGDEILRVIQHLDDQAAGLEWKRLTEDFDTKDPAEKSEGPDVWAAIRANGGTARIGGGYPMVTPSIAAKGFEATTSKPVVMVGTKDLIEEVLSRPDLYSVSEQRVRTAATFGRIYVALDPKDGYEAEACVTNEIVWDYSEYHENDVFGLAYHATAARLAAMRVAAHAIGRTSFKLELRRELFMPVLGDLSHAWFDIPDLPTSDEPQYITSGGWGWEPVDGSAASTVATGERRPRCPGDFMAPSRACFYPKPTPSITSFGVAHGLALKAAAAKIVKKYRDGKAPIRGAISSRMYARIKDDDLVARNLIGIMEGMLPPTDGILRGIVYEWLDQRTLWRHQGALHRRTQGLPPSYADAKAALERAVTEAMCKRPAPDLIYRTATAQAAGVNLGKTVINEGDWIVLGLVSATQASLSGAPDITPVFGGRREKPRQDPGRPLHACPAQKMVMAMVYGILSALLDSGRIVAQPASLIIEIRDNR